MKKGKTKTVTSEQAPKHEGGTSEQAPKHEAANYKRRRVEIETAKLKPAPWNPRREITPESVADLTESIATLGMIQPLVAMMNADGSLTLIAGHRRLAAAKVAGLETVPCDILCGIDEQTARRMTVIENLQRVDADPLMESELVERLLTDGMTKAEIAAETGRGEKWVARRANLVNLSDGWRKRVASGEQITVDCLEHVAAYPTEVQEKLKDVEAYDCITRWEDIESDFDRETQNLNHAKFPTAQCRKCPKNSGCCPDLFDWSEDKPQKLGQCLDAECYERKTEEAVEATIANAKKSGAEIVETKNRRWNVDIRDERDKTRDTLYVWKDYDGRTTTGWGPKPEENEGGAAAKAERQEKLARNKSIRKLAEWCKDNLADAIREQFDVYEIDAHLLQEAFSLGGMNGSWELFGSRTSKQKAAFAAIVGNAHKVPDHWYKLAADEIVKLLGKEAYKDKDAPLVLALFGEARSALTEDERRLIVSDEKLKELQHPKPVEWEEAERDTTEQARSHEGEKEDQEEWEG